MNILIIGINSGISRSIINVYSKGNNLILVGRSKKTLEGIVNNASQNGALNINTIKYDLSMDIKLLINELKFFKIDLFINTASATSHYYDNNINSKYIKDFSKIDLINPILLVDWLINKNNNMNVIFISSILSKIPTPNRIIYSSYKRLQEVYLKRITSNLLIVTVGTEIKKNQESTKSKALAKKIINANNLNKKFLFYGFSGRFLYLIYSLNPFLSQLSILVKRTFSPSNHNSQK